MMTAVSSLPAPVLQALDKAHPSWRPLLERGLQSMLQLSPDYFSDLCKAPYLPTQERMFAAFARPLTDTRYILVGEGPYPREQSATGVCFMDGAVGSLWADDGGGLSKKVNRATSLRNFLKMLLVANGELQADQTSGTAMASVATKALQPGSGFIQTLAELQANLEAQGFLLLNASLVFREHVAPAKDGLAWRPFLAALLREIPLECRKSGLNLPSLVLWGKIAAQLNSLPEAAAYPKIEAEHPYNLSFIRNQEMQTLFSSMRLLDRTQNSV